LPAIEFERIIRASSAQSDQLSEEDAVRTHSKLAAYRRG
jgi:hypothetical protein